MKRNLLEDGKKTVEYEVTVIAIAIDALGTVTERLVLGLEDLELRRQVETIQTTALLRSASILRRIPKT